MILSPAGAVQAEVLSDGTEEFQVEEVPTEEISEEEVPAEEISEEDVPAEDVSEEDVPAEDVPAEETPAEKDASEEGLPDDRSVEILPENEIPSEETLEEEISEQIEEEDLLQGDPDEVGEADESIDVSVETGSGSCGENLTWTMEDGVLTISGSGAMTNFGEAQSPFDSLDFTSLVVNSGVTTIGTNAFQGCTEMQSVTLPETLISIGDYAFAECIVLAGNLSIPLSVETVGEGAFAGCVSLTSLSVYGEITLREYAFADCGLQTVSIPSVTRIPEGAFQNCSSLSQVTAGSVKYIGAWAFAGDTALTSVNLPDIVTIGQYAFSGCSGMASAVFGASFQSTERGAFSQCSSLSQVTFWGTRSQWDAVIIAADNDPLRLASLSCSTAAVTPMYRVYNTVTGEHLYTSDEVERSYLINVAGWNDEGVAWYAPAEDTASAIYRLYNPDPNYSEHHYTADQNEVQVLTTQRGWNNEGIGWMSAGTDGIPVYRLFNPNAISSASSHHYTTDAVERNYLIANGWNDEGIAWYGVNVY